MYVVSNRIKGVVVLVFANVARARLEPRLGFNPNLTLG
jgi:hypothetical protein